MTLTLDPPAPIGRDYLALPRRARVRWVLLLGLLAALGPLTLDLYLPAFPTVQDDLGTTASRVQLTLTGTLLGIGVGQLFVGPLSDAVGRRRPLLAGLGLHVLASLACAVAPNVTVLGGLRVLQGAGAAAAAVVAVAVVQDLFDGPGAARLQSRLVLILGAAPVLSPSVGVLVLELTSWRGLFLALALISAAMAAAVALLLPETLPHDQRDASGPRATMQIYRTLLHDRAVWGVVLTAALTVSAVFSYAASAPFVLQDLYGVSATSFALAFGGLGALFIAGTQLTGKLVTTVAPQRLLALGLGGALAAALVLLALVGGGAGGLAGVLAPLGVMTFGCGVVLPTTPSLLLARHRAAAGTAAALLGAGQFGLGAAALPAVGLAGLPADVTMAVAVAAGLTGALTAFATLVRPRLQRPPTNTRRRLGNQGLVNVAVPSTTGEAPVS